MTTPTPILEQNPALPADTPPQLAQTLSRLFRLIAQVVNPIVAWVASWAGVTVMHPAPTQGDTDLVISPISTPGSAVLVLNKSTGNMASAIQGQRVNALRWEIDLGGTGTETGSGNTGSDFGIYRYSDTGVYLANPMVIRRSDGLVTFTEATAGVQILGTNGLAVSNGGISSSGQLSCATGMGMRWDGANSNFLAMGAGLGNNWTWQWNRSNGLLTWLGGTANSLFSIDSGGNVAANASFVANGTSDGVTGIWAAQRITTNRSDSAAFYAPNGGVQIGPTAYFTVGSYAADGANWWSGVTIANPNWNTVQQQAYHAVGNWAGCRFVTANGVIEFKLSGPGVVNAAGGFTQTSDIRSKDNIEPVTDALDKIDGIQAYTYTFKNASTEFGADKVRHVGLMGQDVFLRLREAVDVGPHLSNVRTLEALPDDATLQMDYAGVTALNSQGISELLQRVKAIETRITALEAA